MEVCPPLVSFIAPHKNPREQFKGSGNCLSKFRISLFTLSSVSKSLKSSSSVYKGWAGAEG